MNQIRQIASLIYGAFTLLVAPLTLPVMNGTAATSGAAVTNGDDLRIPLKEVLGSSGELRALIGTPGSLEQRSESTVFSSRSVQAHVPGGVTCRWLAVGPARKRGAEFRSQDSACVRI